MLEFANYLKENFKEDVSSAEKIIQSKWDKVVAILREAFDDQYSDRKTALYRIQNEFVDPKVAPKSVDVEFLKNNMNYVVDKVNSLDEGEIRIIINNDVQKGSTGASVAGIETESKKGKKKDVVKEEMDEVEPAEGEIEGEIDTGDAGTEDEKVVKVSVADNKVTVEPSENTGLEKSEHEFETEDEAKGFVDSLENLFKGFKVEKEESEEEPAEGESEEAGETEEESTNSNKQVVTEAAEESEESGEEPEDAGEEPEDAGEEPEDAGEEPEDAGEIDWEDIAAGEGEEEGDEDAEECIAPVRPIGSAELESLDLNKLINTIVRVEDKWYKVNTVTENNEVICIDKEGNESYFDLEQIEEMEQTIGELAKSAVSPNAEEETEKPKEAEEETEESEESEDAEEESCPAGAEECVPCKKGEGGAEEEIGLAGALSPEQMAELKAWIANPEEDPSEDLYNALTDYYADEMPYGVAKARTGDPYEWLLNKASGELKVYGGAEEESEKEGSEEESEPAAAEEETGTQEESLSFVKIAANRYFDLDEDALTAPKMAATQSGGLTSKPGVINQTITPVKPAPKAPVVKGPTAALTAKPSKPGEKVETVPAAPTAPAKKGPQQALTAKPKAPPKKTETVKAPPKAPSKAAPKGSFTAKPGKPGEKHDKVKAPEIPAEYKKGGFKG